MESYNQLVHDETHTATTAWTLKLLLNARSITSIATSTHQSDHAAPQKPPHQHRYVHIRVTTRTTTTTTCQSLTSDNHFHYKFRTFIIAYAINSHHATYPGTRFIGANVPEGVTSVSVRRTVRSAAARFVAPCDVHISAAYRNNVAKLSGVPSTERGHNGNAVCPYATRFTLAHARHRV